MQDFNISFGYQWHIVINVYLHYVYLLDTVSHILQENLKSSGKLEFVHQRGKSLLHYDLDDLVFASLDEIMDMKVLLYYFMNLF